MIIDDVYLFESLLDLSVVTIHQGQVLVHLDKFGVILVRRRLHWGINIISGIDLELLQPLGQLLVVLLEVVYLCLASGYSLEQRRVGLLSYLETSDHGLDISDTGVCLDLLEGIVDAARSLHLFVHLPLHKVVPKFVDVQVVSHLELSGIFALIGSRFSDLLVLLLALNSALDRFLLVGDATLELKDALLPIALLLLNVLHQVVEDVLRLQLGLLGLASIVFLAIKDLAFVPETALEVVRLDLAGNKVFLHSL